MSDTRKQKRNKASGDRMLAIDRIEELERENTRLDAGWTDANARALAARLEVIKAVEVMKALQKDMLERSRAGMDTIHGNKYRIVNAGRTAWVEFCAALTELEGEE
jgi:hypothetical protein